MRNVLYHVDDRVVLEIRHLRGALLPDAGRSALVRRSRVLHPRHRHRRGRASRPPASAPCLNDYVFNYKGTPLKHLKVTIDRRPAQADRDVLHKVIDLPFTIRAQL